MYKVYGKRTIITSIYLYWNYILIKAANKLKNSFKKKGLGFVKLIQYINNLF